MSIEPTPNRDDRLSGTHKASIVDTYIAESSVTVGDDAMIEVAPYRNIASERWLRRAIDRDDRVAEDIDSNKDDVEENEVAREEGWTDELMRKSLFGFREIAGALDAPATASVSDVGYALIHAYESSGGYKTDGGDWDLALGGRHQCPSDCAAASPPFVPSLRTRSHAPLRSHHWRNEPWKEMMTRTTTTNTAQSMHTTMRLTVTTSTDCFRGTIRRPAGDASVSRPLSVQCPRRHG